MPVASGMPVGMTKIKYLFIDGGYLREVIDQASKQFFDGRALPVDYQLLSRGFTKCFYYDCVPPQKRSETPDDYKRRCEAHHEYFRRLRMIDGWHVFEGVLTGRGAEARQKQVDIQIAVDMLSHSHLRNMQEIDFIAGDQDFKPLVDALVREGMYVRLWYEQRSASKELVFAADARRALSTYDIHSFLTQEFQHEWKMPHRYSQPGKKVENSILLGRASGASIEIEVWKLVEGGFQITHVDPLNRGYYHHISHSNLDYLKQVYESLYGTTSWEIGT
jgi:uncharacterized LabA/DUF88 family protein